MYKRILVKVGTNLITGEKGIRKEFLESFTAQIASLHKKGKEVIVVTSGAVGCGLKKMKMEKRPFALSEKQAIAAIGQIELMDEYKRLFSLKGITAAQLLLTHDDVKDKARNINARNTIAKLLEWKAVPVINENDTVATEELKFGDNDALAGIVGSMMDVDAVVILTSVDGVFDKNPHEHKDALIIKHIDNVDKAMTTVNTDGKTTLGTGGMLSKMEIARNLNHIGIPLIIANGTKKGVLERIACGESEGTLISPKGEKAGSNKRWIVLSLKVKGAVKIDAGAQKALLDQGKSLLAVGITGMSGEFNFGDAVEITGAKGEKLGKGIINYSCEDLKAIRGKKNAEIKKIMGGAYYDEAVHRDNLFIYR